MNKTRKKINQQACYNRIWSWSPMPCEKHGPRASVTTKTSAFGLGFCLLSPSGHVFHTTRETMIKSYSTWYQPRWQMANGIVNRWPRAGSDTEPLIGTVVFMDLFLMPLRTLIIRYHKIPEIFAGHITSRWILASDSFNQKKTQTKQQQQ